MIKRERSVPYHGQGHPFVPDHGLRQILLVILIVAVLVGGGVISYINHLGNNQVTESYVFSDNVFLHQQRPTLFINDDCGTVTIHSQKKGPYGFTVTRASRGFGLGLTDISVDYTQKKNVVDIEARIPENYRFWGRREVNLDVVVPLATDIEVFSQIGPISISDVQGLMKLTAVQGNIDLHNVLLNGKSTIDVAQGSITFQGGFDPHSHSLFVAEPGPLTLSLPASSAFQLNIAPGSGSVKNEFGHASNGYGDQAVVTLSTDKQPITIHRTR
jgi:hypothetical protein